MMENAKKPYHCNICGKDFSLSVTFKAHTLLHERESPYKCSWCGAAFRKNSIALKDHMRNHLNDYDNCKKKETTSKVVGKHSDESGISHYSCNICHVRLTTKSEIIDHKKSHAKKRDFNCHLCCKKFFSKRSLDSHVRNTHDVEHSFVCEHCGEKFRNKTVLKMHSRTHTMTGQNQCKECGNFYRSKKVLKNHYTREHTTSNLHSQWSYHVENTTSRPSNLNSKRPYHVENTASHPPNLHSQQLYVVENTSYFPSNLHTSRTIVKVEAQASVNNKPERSSAGESLKNKQGYNNKPVHLISNVEKTKGYKADNNQVNKKCKQSNHEIIYPKENAICVEKKYICSSCGKILSSQKGILNHMLTHSESAWYNCKQCGAVFSNRAQLNTHLEEHFEPNNTNVESVVCEALKSQEKITLYVNKESLSSDETTIPIEERTMPSEDAYSTPPKSIEEEVNVNKSTGDVMVIEDGVVIDVEEVIIADKDTQHDEQHLNY